MDAQPERALVFAENARAVSLPDRFLAAERDCLVASALSVVFQKTGDLPAAVAEQNKVIDVFEREADLIGPDRLDIGVLSNAVLSLGGLYLEMNDLVLARSALEQALAQIGERSDVLFKLAELERKSGNETKGLRFYRQALRKRKEAGSEMAVLFGTNRRRQKGPERGGFSGKAAKRISLGEAVVFVPGGEFAPESWLATAPPESVPVGFATNPEPLIIRRKDLLALKQFSAQAAKRIARARLYPKSAFVFIHGYNVPFDAELPNWSGISITTALLSFFPGLR